MSVFTDNVDSQFKKLIIITTKEMMRRNAIYTDFEAHDRENCRLVKMGGAQNA